MPFTWYHLICTILKLKKRPDWVSTSIVLPAPAVKRFFLYTEVTYITAARPTQPGDDRSPPSAPDRAHTRPRVGAETLSAPPVARGLIVRPESPAGRSRLRPVARRQNGGRSASWPSPRATRPPIPPQPRLHAAPTHPSRTEVAPASARAPGSRGRLERPRSDSPTSTCHACPGLCKREQRTCLVFCGLN